MLNEYYLQGKMTLLLTNINAVYPISETSIGEDEFDAINRYVTKYAKEQNLPLDALYVNYCRLRPTGRQKNGISSPTPFFDHNETIVHNKGLVSRFYIRFLLSETEQELIDFYTEFETFRDRFKPDTAQYLYNFFLQQLNKIRTGIIKHDTYNFKENMPKFDTYTYLNIYLNKAIHYLSMYGFRVILYNNKYKLLIPTGYNLVKCLKEDEEKILSPLDLILYWEWKANLHYGLKTNIGITTLGSGFTTELINNLDLKGITPLISNDNIPVLYIIDEEVDKALEVLNSLGLRVDDSLFEDKTITSIPAYPNSSGYDWLVGETIEEFYEH